MFVPLTWWTAICVAVIFFFVGQFGYILCRLRYEKRFDEWQEDATRFAEESMNMQCRMCKERNKVKKISAPTIIYRKEDAI